MTKTTVTKVDALGFARVETSRPLRIANSTKDLAKMKRAIGNDTEAKIIEEAAAEIERLHSLLKDALKVAEKAVNVHR